MKQYSEIKITKTPAEPAKKPLKRKSDELETIMNYYYKEKCEKQQETIAEYAKQLKRIDDRATRLLDELATQQEATHRQHRRAAAYFSMFTNEHNQNSQLVNLFEQLQEEMMSHGHIMEALHLQDRVEAITSQGNVIDLTLADTEIDSDTD